MRRSLIFYFSRRHCRTDAEDMAQETLAALWRRSDYEFDKEEDVHLVGYAFARNILRAQWRSDSRSATLELDPSLAQPIERIGGLNAAEMKIYLEEIEKLRQSQLTDRERQLIENALNPEGAPARAEKDPREAGNLRVFLHRSRKKLARLAGWRK